ncbi:MAG: DUF1684 domain-containing protein [bacterium]|nr:MAG: DUF1684 domain-containing protein [bacterium]
MVQSKFFLIILIGWFGLSLVSCRERLSPEQQQYIQEVLTFRMEKDSLFKHADWSPILNEEKGDFSGLKYYPVDVSLRFEGPITPYDTLVPDTIIGTKGDLRPAHRYGYFAFQHQGRTHRLVIFRIERNDPKLEPYLFLGFTDETTADETYGTGRYLDLSENPENHYIIDFNLAYNPYCAYNPRYTCAIPADDNHLPFSVRAGEKIYQDHK